jgi:hypothetical protein
MPDPAPATPRPEDTAAVDAPLPTLTSFSYSAGAYRYELVSESEVRQPSDSSAVAATVRTRALVILRLDSLSGDSLSVELTLDSVSAERDSLIPAADSVAPASSPFAAIVDRQGLPLAGTEAEVRECAEPDASDLLAVARDLLVRVPRELRVGATWSDTSTVTICRGGVPVTSGVVRTYEVLDPRRAEDGTPLVRIARTTSFSLAGSRTTEYGQVIALSGSGESRATLELDAGAGIVRSATREGTSAVTVTYGRSTMPFEQRVVQSVRLLEDPAAREPER